MQGKTALPAQARGRKTKGREDATIITYPATNIESKGDVCGKMVENLAGLADVQKKPEMFCASYRALVQEKRPRGCARWTIPAPNVYNEYNENQRRRERQPAALRLCVKGATR